MLCCQNKECYSKTCVDLKGEEMNGHLEELTNFCELLSLVVKHVETKLNSQGRLWELGGETKMYSEDIR